MIRFMTFAAAVLLAACPAAHANWNSTISASNPLNWYRFDETSGSTVYDYGSEGLNGTYGGYSSLHSPSLGEPGVVGGAVEFDLASIVVLNGASLVSDWTVEFIIKKTAESRAQALLSQQFSFSDDTYALKLEQWESTHQLGYTHYAEEDYLFSPPSAAPLNQFIGLAYVKTADGIKLYIDGELAGTNSTAIPLPRQWVSDNLDSMQAILDEVVIYDRALSSTEIANHFASIPGPGDFNHDGSVDAADYVVWRDGLGTIYTQGHYDLWVANFGRTFGSGGRTTFAAVPETSTVLPIIAAAFAALAANRRLPHAESNFSTLRRDLPQCQEEIRDRSNDLY